MKNEETAGGREEGQGEREALGVRNICVHKENVTPLKMDIAYAVQRDRITCLTGNVDGAEREVGIEEEIEAGERQ